MSKTSENFYFIFLLVPDPKIIIVGLESPVRPEER